MAENVDIPVRVHTNRDGWVGAHLVCFGPKRVLVRLADGRVIHRRKGDIQMDDLAKAMAIAYNKEHRAGSPE